MFWRKDEALGDVFIVAWINIVKECRLKEKDGRFIMEVIRK